ncbi:hypothetical protein E2P81_ATG08331 [Venturia nashicola]|uniref:Uncharacterized protein n=1 Tax=Venturia nashicola TaxID=86259 RepID=A0A4Z1P1J2_9PEZI|nr:hypothetical protein E6O75_ATG08519 [Venturia nashicola]TLD21743.1 hypothetical protein E2P81_ATG08331 [Venturia nashicola]
MLLTTALSFTSLLATASATPLQPRNAQVYKDIAQVLDRLVVTVTTIGSHVAAWPGNPKRPDTVNQILNYIPTIQQDCANLISDLQVGTDWVQRTTKKDSIGAVDAAYLVPKLASLNNAVSAYKEALLLKRAWADTSSITPELYRQLVLQKQGATQLSTTITQSLGITTSWLGGPVSDFFFGAKLDGAIKAYADAARYQPNGQLSQGGPPFQNGQQSAPYPPTVPSLGPQNWPGGQQQGQPGGQQQGQSPYPAQGQPPYQSEGQGGWGRS